MSNFEIFQTLNWCSASCSAMAFQNVPDKALVPIVNHVQTTIQIRNGDYGDILDVTQNAGQQGVIISAISRSANLSHYAVLDKCDKLISAGLVETKRDDRNRKFRITEKGLEFFQEFKTFQNLLESMNLRY